MAKTVKSSDIWVEVLSDSFRTITFQVLGYYNRRGIDAKAFLKEIKDIATDPDDKHFFNVTDEAALKDIVDALGERIFSLEGSYKGIAHCDALFQHHSEKLQSVTLFTPYPQCAAD